MDTKNWPALQSLFLPTARLTFLGLSSAVALAASQPLDFPSPAAFVTRISRLFANARTLHRISAGELELLPSEGEGDGDGDRVSAIWAMEDMLVWSFVLGVIPITARGGGYYYEVWERRGDDWFLASLRLERTFMEYSVGARAVTAVGRLAGARP